MNEQMQLLDSVEAAALLHQTPRTMRRFATAHIGPPAFKDPSGRWLWWKRDLLRFIGEMRTEAIEAWEDD